MIAKLNDDSCADESCDEALKDRFVEAIARRTRTKPISKV